MRLPLAALLLAPLAAPTNARTHDHATAGDPTMGVHGMMLFGGADGLFASHLPLFRPPHDRRILLRLKIADPTLDRAVKTRLAAEPELWTIEPERFALSRLLPGAVDPIRSFRATLVRGHFERGGRVAHRDVAIRVVKVVENSAIAPAAATPARLTYRVVGRGRSWFLVKNVDARPDFDHVVALAPGARPKVGQASLARRGLEAPSLDALGAAAGARASATLYYETDDLS